MTLVRALAAACSAGLFALVATPVSAHNLSAQVEDGTGFAPVSYGTLKVGDRAFVSASVATVWTKPDSPRTVDQPALAANPGLTQWDEGLKTPKIRRELTGRIQTQAAYGQEVKILETTKNWAKVSVHGQQTPKQADGYPGWVPTAQLVKNDRFYEIRKEQPVAIVSEKTLQAHDPAFLPAGTEQAPELVYNVELPVVEQDEEDVRVALPAGGVAWVPANSVWVTQEPAGNSNAAKTQREREASPAALVDEAKRFLDVPYLWGGVSPHGFDSSGYTHSVYRSFGIDIPRDAADQSKAGTTVNKKSLQPGDLLFFADNKGRGKVFHVGMYVGGGKMIHAPNADAAIHITDWKVWDSKKQFAGAKRFL